jgi:hypothetical protein
MTRLALVAWLAFCGVAQAEPISMPQALTGMDPKDFHTVLATCERYMRDRDRAPMLIVSWAMGYLEALNFGRLLGGDDEREILIQPAEIDHWLVTYCKQQPQDSVGFGVQQLYRNRPLVPGSQADFQRRRGS